MVFHESAECVLRWNRVSFAGNLCGMLVRFLTELVFMVCIGTAKHRWRFQLMERGLRKSRREQGAVPVAERSVFCGQFAYSCPRVCPLGERCFR